MSVDISKAFSSLLVIRAIQYSRLATVSIIFFDHLTMFDQEVEHIWKGHWTFINALYLANRYYALVAAVLLQHESDRSCIAFHKWEGWTGLLFSVFGQVILQIRLYALYALHKRRKAITISVIAAFVLCTSLCAWLMWKNILRVQGEQDRYHGNDAQMNSNGVAVSTPIPGGTFCTVPDLHGASSIYAFWIPIIAFESLLCVLALLPAVQAFLEGDIYFTNSGRLIRVLLRDSVIYFFVIAISAAACLIGARVRQGILLDAPVGFSVAMTATIGSRLILNIRGAGRGHQEFVDSSGRALVDFHDVVLIRAT